MNCLLRAARRSSLPMCESRTSNELTLIPQGTPELLQEPFDFGGRIVFRFAQATLQMHEHRVSVHQFGQ